MGNMISTVQRSNLFTMGCTAKLDERQKVPSQRSMPDAPTRELRAKLILEEALETIKGLGVIVRVAGDPESIVDLAKNDLLRYDTKCPDGSDPHKDMEEIIDGCCDLIYVAVGTLCVCGVPDVPHLKEVNRANNAKFPNGEPVMHPTIPGKFGKPPGWTPPNHDIPGQEGFDLSVVQKNVMAYNDPDSAVDTKRLAQMAYEAYCEQVDWRSPVTGDNLPKWEEMKAVIKAAWSAAAEQIVHHTLTVEM